MIHEVLHDMFSLPVPVLEKVLRTIVVYLFLVVVLRLAGKRELGQFNRFDLVVLLTLSNTLQNAIIGEDNSVVGGLIGAAVLIGFNSLAARAEFSHRWLAVLIEGRPTILIENGRVLTKNLDKEHLTEAELTAVCHKQGITNFHDIERAVLETSGMISVIARTPTRDEVLLAAISERLERVEALLRERPPAAAQA
jgi:uncharacterized membrane protein YcaP (DUF421 family)